jgi:hypothetical protein
MTGSFEPVDAAAGDEIRVVYAVGSALYQVVSTGRQSLALALPDASQRIFGVAIDGEATWFSTSHAVYALTDGLAVPVVTGIGGALRAAAGALYVLDAVHRRVYRIVPRDGGAP